MANRNPYSTYAATGVTPQDRLAHLDEQSASLHGIIEERGAAFGDDPYGKSGLYKRNFKIRGSREHPVLVEEYVFDHKMISEILRIHRRMAAIEMIEERAEAKRGQKQRAKIETRKLRCGLEGCGCSSPSYG